MKPLSVMRTRARDALRLHFILALVATLLASLPSLLLQAAVIFSQDSFLHVPQQYQYAQMTDEVFLRVLRGTVSYLPSNVRLLWQLLPVSYLILPFLNLGRLYLMLRMIRGLTVTAGDLFARACCFLKAIVLQVIISVKVLLWGLPGFAVMVLSVFVLQWTQSLDAFTFLYMAGLAVMIVLMIHASLSYAMAPLRMADQKERGPVECLRTSKQWMRGRTRELFAVIAFFFLYMLLNEIVSSLAANISDLLGTVVSLILSLIVNAYLQMTVCVWYEENFAGLSQTAQETEKRDPFAAE